MGCRRRVWISVLAVFVVLAAACAAEETDTGQAGETVLEPVAEQVEPESSEPEAAPITAEPEPESVPTTSEAEAEPEPAPTTSAATEVAAEPEPEATTTTVPAAEPEPETTTGEPEAEQATASESDAASEPESEEEPVEAEEPPPEEDKAPEPESDTASEPEPDTAPEPASEQEQVGEEEPPPEEDEAPDQPEPSSGVAAALARLNALTVAAEHTSGYDRHLFKHWTDEDDDGCDTRREVLLAEAVVAPTQGSRCSLSAGEWISRYDGLTEMGNGRGFDVDHLVPLAEAWESGAHSWSPDRRERYANDLGYEHSLIAVSARSNRSKGAQDPATWLPPEAGQHCWYAAAWVHVKTRWKLTVDTMEVNTLQSILSGCSDTEIDVGLPAPVVEEGGHDATTEAQRDSTAEEPATEDPGPDCHPAYTPCLPNLPGDALNCGDLTPDQKPVTVNEIGVDPYRLDRDGDGQGCTS